MILLYSPELRVYFLTRDRSILFYANECRDDIILLYNEEYIEKAIEIRFHHKFVRARNDARI